jgi:hypothetical protein
LVLSTLPLVTASLSVPLFTRAVQVSKVVSFTKEYSEEERVQPYTVPIGQTGYISFQKKRQNLDPDYTQPATLRLVTAYVAISLIIIEKTR